MSRRPRITGAIISGLLAAALSQSAHDSMVSTAGFTSTAGLDLAGNFIQAVNNGGGAITNVGGLDFSASAFFVGDGQSQAATAGFSESELDFVMKSFRYFSPSTSISASIPVTSGDSYKLQLLFWEPDPAFQESGRDFTITMESDVLNDFKNRHAKRHGEQYGRESQNQNNGEHKVDCQKALVVLD